VEEWRTTIGTAEAAWARLDVEGFRTSTDLQAALLPCLAEPLLPSDAALAHRVQGLRADVLGDREVAAAAFLAARRLDPDWRFPERFPENHPLRLLYGRLSMDGLTPAFLPNPRGGEVLIDGKPGRTRMKGVPVVVQWRSSSGSVEYTAYLRADDESVGYPLAPDKKPAGWALLGLGAASALASGISLAVAADARAEYDDPSTLPDALPGLRSTTNGAFWVSVGTGAGAAGAVVAGLVVLRL
jgi:hypothetical protein